MNFLNRINGAVFFVDILGFGALTQNKITLNKKDYGIWLDKYHQAYDNQILAATILAEFRDILNDFDLKFPTVTISQLSDCAFIWSENIMDVIIVANNVMSKCISNGIFCRGGLSYGEIIETVQNHNLGRFIVGDAVTEAVKLEGSAKGCRIMMSQEIPTMLYQTHKDFSDKISPLFKPFTNPLDYVIYDEFKWYFVPFMDENIEDLTFSNSKTKVELTIKRLKLANFIRLHPKFSWNSKSREGLIHLIASVNFIAENNDDVFNMSHEFGWENVVEKRTQRSISIIEKKIEKEIK